MKEIIKTLKRLKKRQQKLQNQILEKQQELINICVHADIEIKKFTIPGSYYDRSQYVTQTICSVCGKLLNEHSVAGSYE